MTAAWSRIAWPLLAAMLTSLMLAVVGDAQQQADFPFEAACDGVGRIVHVLRQFALGGFDLAFRRRFAEGWPGARWLVGSREAV
ncbi:MAG: hypothetical protein V9F01_15440 [Chitinophagaceae bacterium]